MVKFYGRKDSPMDKQRKPIFSSKKTGGEEGTNNEFVNMKHSLFLMIIVSGENL